MSKQTFGKPRLKPARTVKIFVGTRNVGEVTGDIYYKRVNGQVHMLKRPRAWAFDVSALHDAEEAGACKIVLTDTNANHKIYRIDMVNVWRFGVRFNRGYGEQIFVPLDKWHTDDAEQLKLL